ncbi:hypothetical protein A3F02_00730 [Candidatus Curtissbacteria bacterium RIFCSPHIGHO2_12_FULL_38_9b]|uniref:Uncharacterized protein n=2 Tax=Candidatus Curtissiibacteriota TaxID=1752717 RepID=A0A1F5GXN2_9BACT|nr:MAG: hypothetical protein A3A48_02995 [Candidatus Curtissbacteria bacterium RIFCSPLOWO2_01_FULL_37_9]OGD96527.1 MAG: hypothetical protein A3F02_00730 [Candidatus Curtissbacteria bacterium RIFCSPHIGHO2_12_FULL_38_9b]
MAQSKTQKLKSLKKKLKELEDVKLKQALARYGEAYQASGAAWQENAAWELADEEVSVLRAMVAEIKDEIKSLEHPNPQASLPTVPLANRQNTS